MFIIFVFFCVVGANFRDKWAEFQNEMNCEYRESHLIKNGIDALHYTIKVDSQDCHIGIIVDDMERFGVKISVRRNPSYSLIVTYYKFYKNKIIIDNSNYFTKEYAEGAINLFKMGEWGMASSSFGGCSLYPLVDCDDYSMEYTNNMEAKLKKIAEEELRKYGDFIFLGDVSHGFEQKSPRRFERRSSRESSQRSPCSW